MWFINLLLISGVLIMAAFVIHYVFGSNEKDENDYSLQTKIYSTEYLAREIRDTFNEIIRANINELNLNEYETKKRENNKRTLRLHLHNCSCGDIGAKIYVKDYIKNILSRKYDINSQTINQVVQFQLDYAMNTIEKFDVLLYTYKKKYKLSALEVLLHNYNLDQPKKSDSGFIYEITEDDIQIIYEKEITVELSYVDKMELLAQWIYQKNYGHGVIDEIRDMKIDGVSGGVSGLSSENYHYVEEAMINDSEEIKFSYNSVWILFQGKSIHLKFLGFGRQKELERVCKNIYRYNSPGQLSQEKGHIENDMKDGSRVVVARTNFSNSWAFFVRKHDNLKSVNIRELITDKGNDKVISIIQSIVKGNNNIIISGNQACGKTTLLKSMIEFIDSSYNLRIQELIFELHLEKIYPDRNILSFRELPTVNGIEALDFQKKTDGTVNIIGEIASAPVACWYVQTSQVASLFGLGTHHGKTTADLLTWMRNALLTDGGFNSESAAMEQAVQAIRFDVHMTSDIHGHRYIERITEIVPVKHEEWPEDDVNACMIRYFKEMTEPKYYDAVNIVEFENGEYIIKNKISDYGMNQMKQWLTECDMEELKQLWGEIA